MNPNVTFDNDTNMFPYREAHLKSTMLPLKLCQFL